MRKLTKKNKSYAVLKENKKKKIKIEMISVM